MGVEVKIEFERECYTCYGRAAWSTNEDCKTCGGSGRVATELGDDLLEFLEHQGFRPAARKDNDDGTSRT